MTKRTRGGKRVVTSKTYISSGLDLLKVSIKIGKEWRELKNGKEWEPTEGGFRLLVDPTTPPNQN